MILLILFSEKLFYIKGTKKANDKKFIKIIAIIRKVLTELSRAKITLPISLLKFNFRLKLSLRISSEAFSKVSFCNFNSSKECHIIF